MTYNIGDKVRIVDLERVKSDALLEDIALRIIQRNKYKGEVTKIIDDVYFVGFKNELGWVTQGYRAEEIKEAK